MKQNRTLYDFRSEFDRGRPLYIQLAWLLLSRLILTSFVPGTIQRRWLLLLFGAQVGNGVVLKPGMKVKFPWKLEVGDHSWIGEDVWIDNLAPVTIGNNVCISQGAYFCTGNHDWSSATFDLRIGEIVVEEGAWVAARSVIGPGVTVSRNAVVALGAVATRSVPSNHILVHGDLEYKAIKRSARENK